MHLLVMFPLLPLLQVLDAAKTSSGGATAADVPPSATSDDSDI